MNYLKSWFFPPRPPVEIEDRIIVDTHSSKNDVQEMEFIYPDVDDVERLVVCGARNVTAYVTDTTRLRVFVRSVGGMGDASVPLAELDEKDGVLALRRLGDVSVCVPAGCDTLELEIRDCSIGICINCNLKSLSIPPVKARVHIRECSIQSIMCGGTDGGIQLTSVQVDDLDIASRGDIVLHRVIARDTFRVDSLENGVQMSKCEMPIDFVLNASKDISVMYFKAMERGFIHAFNGNVTLKQPRGQPGKIFLTMYSPDTRLFVDQNMKEWSVEVKRHE